MSARGEIAKSQSFAQPKFGAIIHNVGLQNMNCGIYIRKSREKGNRRESYRLSYQREVLPAYAKSRGWHYQLYDDGFASGSDMANLPELNRLIRDIEAGHIQVVLTIEFSRLSRDETLRQFTYFLDLCAQHQVAIATETAYRRPWIPMEWQMCILEGSFSAVEMKVIRQRMEEGQYRAIMKGKWLGEAPFGYRLNKNDGHLYIDPKEGPILKRILELAKENSTRRIEAALITERGRRGGHFTMERIRRMISDQRLLFYTGYRRYDGKLVRGDWDQLIDFQTMRQIQENKIRLSNRGRSQDTTPAYLLTGLNVFKCAYCGKAIKSQISSKFRVRTNTWYRLKLYGCKSVECHFQNHFYKMDYIDGIVLKSIKKVLRDTDVVEQGFRALGIHDKKNTELERLKRQLERKFVSKENLISAIEKGILDESEISERMAKLRSDIEKIERRIEKIVQKEEEENKDQISLEDIQKIKNTVLDHLDEMPQENLRQLIKDLIHEIRLFRNYLEIKYKFPINKKGEYKKRIRLKHK